MLSKFKEAAYTAILKEELLMATRLYRAHSHRFLCSQDEGYARRKA